ncbi:MULTISPECIES: baseplate J/gp47 family protein [unclassified Desulfovibrio]|uniref:baseplate J/gp47 family protein n=1 Tax=unclassified Desulfovibrio TaxID=2593640 RepID=UPI0013EBF945|nr:MULTISPECIES: baseplate J/gp47 family protein [unclassified Desulfovibrio]
MPESAYIDRDGYHLPEYPATLEKMQQSLRDIFGADLYLEPDSQEGQLAAIVALAQQDTYALACAVYNAFSPQTAQGAGLSRMVIINGIRRQAAGVSTAPVRLTGVAGTIIKAGQLEDDAGRKWDLPAEVIIPVAGEITVTATAQEAGDIHAAAGEIKIIATPCRGWQSAVNTVAATPGRAVETDAALRERQAVSTALPSRTVFEGTLGAVAAVPGVTRWRGYENDTNVEDANNLPPHSICLVVEGGDARAIADAIAVKKTPGCYTYGNVEVLTRDEMGVPNPIRFFYAAPVRVRLRVTLKPLAGFLSSTAQAIRENLAAYVNALPIGEDVLVSRLLCPINEADVPGRRSFDVLAVELCTGDAPDDAAEWQQANLPITFNAAASCAVEDVLLPGGD